jgi:hypothetical protein
LAKPLRKPALVAALLRTLDHNEAPLQPDEAPADRADSSVDA